MANVSAKIVCPFRVLRLCKEIDCVFVVKAGADNNIVLVGKTLPIEFAMGPYVVGRSRVALFTKAHKPAALETDTVALTVANNGAIGQCEPVSQPASRPIGQISQTGDYDDDDDGDGDDYCDYYATVFLA